jgi:hypothetical protein
MLARSIAVTALTTAALAGCFTAQAAVGPTMSSTGTAGLIATGGVGEGWSFRGRQAVYGQVSGGVQLDAHARGVLLGELDYQRFDDAWGMRLGLRFGPVFGRSRYGLAARHRLGLGFTIFPWIHGGAHDERDGSWNPMPLMTGWRALGVEVAVDALMPEPNTPERTTALVSVSVVGELVSMFDK